MKHCGVHGKLSSTDVKLLNGNLTCKVCLDNSKDEEALFHHVNKYTRWIEKKIESEREIDPIFPGGDGLYHASDPLRLSKSHDVFLEPYAEGYASLIQSLRDTPTPTKAESQENLLSELMKLRKAQIATIKALKLHEGHIGLTQRLKRIDKKIEELFSRIRRDLIHTHAL